MARLLQTSGALIQHIPRTGGTTISRLITDLNIDYNMWLKHQPSAVVKKHALLHQYWRSRLKHVKFVAAFVRHPIQYYESAWKWLHTCNSKGFMYRKYEWHPFASASRWYRGDFNARLVAWVAECQRKNAPLPQG